MKKSITSFSQAFTLIELLIVVAIIGILVGIGVPALRNSRQNAVDSKADTITAQLATAKTRYILDLGEASWNGLADNAARFTALQPYILVNGVPVASIAELCNGLPTAAQSALVIGDVNTAPNFGNGSALVW